MTFMPHLLVNVEARCKEREAQRNKVWRPRPALVPKAPDAGKNEKDYRHNQKCFVHLNPPYACLGRACLRAAICASFDASTAASALSDFTCSAVIAPFTLPSML